MPSPNRTEIKTIDWCRRLNLTQFGNPRIEVHFTDGTEAITSSDAACAHGLDGAASQGVPIAFTFTPAGRITGAIPDPCTGSGRRWGSGTGTPICPVCHHGPASLHVGRPAFRGGHWTGTVPAHRRREG